MNNDYSWRHTVITATIAFALVVFVACRNNEDSTTCSSDTDCGSNGSCLVAPVSKLQFCAEAARGCPTGQRWAASAGDELAGECVVPTPTDAGVPDAHTDGAVQ